MILFANGDSFTYGYELNNREDSWPNKLGEMINADKVYNYGICSASNEYITRTTIDFILNNSNIDFNDLLIIIGWSSDIRWEGFLDDYNSFVQLKLGREMRLVDEKDCSIIRNDELTKIISKSKLNIYNNISEDFLATFKKSLIYNNLFKYYNIFSMHEMLKSFNIKHIFFNSLIEYSKVKHKMVIPKTDELLTRKDMIVNVEKVKNILINDKCWIENTMEDFCKTYPKGKIEGHPLEEGHLAWAKYVFKILKELY